jgi:hypothetical protein
MESDMEDFQPKAPVDLFNLKDQQTPVLRLVDLHHDGHGLNESIVILSDEPDVENGGGAAHHYTATINGKQVLDVQFQHGPRNEAGSTPGVTEAVLLGILIDRLRGFQDGPFSCRENAIQLTKLEECLHWTKARADARAKRNVLGKNLK